MSNWFQHFIARGSQLVLWRHFESDNTEDPLRDTMTKEEVPKGDKPAHAVNTSSPFLQPPPEPATGLGEYRLLAPKAAVWVSPLQLGGMAFGDTWTHIAGKTTKEDVFKLLDAFVEAGGNFLDT